jgi:hypothetical protein
MRKMVPVRKALRARDIPSSWPVDLPDDPDAPVTVWIGLAEESPTRPLVDFIRSGKGVHRTRAEADAHISALRDKLNNYCQRSVKFCDLMKSDMPFQRSY